MLLNLLLKEEASVGNSTGNPWVYFGLPPPIPTKNPYPWVFCIPAQYFVVFAVSGLFYGHRSTCYIKIRSIYAQEQSKLVSKSLRQGNQCSWMGDERRSKGCSGYPSFTKRSAEQPCKVETWRQLLAPISVTLNVQGVKEVT